MRQNQTKVKRGKVLLNATHLDLKRGAGNLTSIIGDIKAKTLGTERQWKAVGEGMQIQAYFNKKGGRNQKNANSSFQNAMEPALAKLESITQIHKSVEHSKWPHQFPPKTSTIVLRPRNKVSSTLEQTYKKTQVEEDQEIRVLVTDRRQPNSQRVSSLEEHRCNLEIRARTESSVADSPSRMIVYKTLQNENPQTNIHFFDGEDCNQSTGNQTSDNFQQQDYKQQRSKCSPFAQHMNQADQLRLQQAMIKSEHRSPSGNFEQHLSQAQKRCFFTDATPRKPINSTFSGPIGGAVYKNHNGTFLKQTDRTENESPSGTYDQLNKYSAPLKRRSKRINAQARNAESFMNNAVMLQQTTKQNEQTRQKQKVRLLEVLPQTLQQRIAPKTAQGQQNLAQGSQFIPLPLDQPATSSGMRSPGTERVGNFRLGQGQASTQKAVARILNSTTRLSKLQQHPVPVEDDKTKPKGKEARNRSIPTPSSASASRHPSYNVLPNQAAGDQLGLKNGQMATPVLVPASALFNQGPGKQVHLNANNINGVPTNGYLLGYINPAQAGPQSQVLIPALAQNGQNNTSIMTQSLLTNQTHPEFFRSKKSVRQSIETGLSPNNILMKNEQQLHQRRCVEKGNPSNQNVLLFEDSTQKMKAPTPQWDNQLTQDSNSDEENIAIKGTGVSLQLDRSPTELLKRVVRLRSQQQKSSPNNSKQQQPGANGNSPIFGHQLMPQNQIMIPASYLKTLYNQPSNQSVDQSQQQSRRFAHQLQQPQIHNSYEQGPNPKTLVFLAVVQQPADKILGSEDQGERRQIYENIRRQNNQWLATNNFYPGQYSSMTSQQTQRPSLQLGGTQGGRREWRPPSRQGSKTRERLKSQTDLHSTEGKTQEEKINPYLKENILRPPKRDDIIPSTKIVTIFKPPSALRLMKECQKFDQMIAQVGTEPQDDPFQDKKQQEDPQCRESKRRKAAQQQRLSINLKDHPINVVLRRGNEFINETFQKSSDNKIDLKKVQALCNFFRIALPYRVSWDQQKLKSREFLINAKERILICLYETINKENGMIRPDMPTRVTAQTRFPDGDQVPQSNFAMPTNSSAQKEIQEKEVEQRRETFSQFAVNPYLPNQRKFYIARGNNHQIVRIVFKQRWWWQQTRPPNTQTATPNFDFTQNNFLWTQWPQPNLSKQLPSFQKKTQHEQNLNFAVRVDENEPKLTTKELAVLNSNQFHLYAKLEANYHLTNKKALFWNMMNYYQRLGCKPFENLPVTFHIENGLQDPEFRNFKNYFNRFDSEIKKRSQSLSLQISQARKRAKKQRQKDGSQSPTKGGFPPQERYLFESYDPDSLSYFEDEHVQQKYGIYVGRNIWILKPGENSNRGCGIYVCNTMGEVVEQVQNDARKGHTTIIQKYIDRPLLFAGRKFDIRIFAVLSSVNSQMKGYFYNDGYLRTSSKEFSLDNLASRFVHLTNDAIQETSEEYGRFESGNKLSFQQFQRYLEAAYPQQKINFIKDLLPQMKRLVTDSFQATFAKIDPHRRQHSFEIYGYDFMIDQNFKVYIIECNTNPSLQLCCPLMARIVPAMLDNVFRMVVDPLMPPPDFNMAKKNLMHDIFPINKLELVFDERLSGPSLRNLFKDEPQLNLKIDKEENNKEEDMEYASDSDEAEEAELANVGEDIFVESASGGSARSQ